MNTALRTPVLLGFVALLASCGTKEGLHTESHGDQVSFGEYRAGQRYGVWSFFDRKTGSLVAIGSYEEGLKDGQWTYHYPDKSQGQPGTHVRASGRYLLGERHGQWSFWLENGTVDVRRTGIYQFGEYVGPGESTYGALYPSKQAAAALREAGLLDDRVVSFVDRDGVFGGGRWFVSAHTIGENALFLYLSRNRNGDHAETLPASTDGDVADLFYRIKGRRPDSLDGHLSGEYALFLRQRRGKPNGTSK